MKMKILRIVVLLGVAAALALFAKPAKAETFDIRVVSNVVAPSAVATEWPTSTIEVDRDELTLVGGTMPLTFNTLPLKGGEVRIVQGPPRRDNVLGKVFQKVSPTVARATGAKAEWIETHSAHSAVVGETYIGKLAPGRYQVAILAVYDGPCGAQNECYVGQVYDVFVRPMDFRVNFCKEDPADPYSRVQMRLYIWTADGQHPGPVSYVARNANVGPQTQSPVFVEVDPDPRYPWGIRESMYADDYDFIHGQDMQLKVWHVERVVEKGVYAPSYSSLVGCSQGEYWPEPRPTPGL